MISLILDPGSTKILSDLSASLFCRDVNEKMPGLLAASRDFFRNYKVPRGGQYNIFGFEGLNFILIGILL